MTDPGPAGYGPSYAPTPPPYEPFGPVADFADRAVATLWDLLYTWPGQLTWFVGMLVMIAGAITLGVNDGGAVGGVLLAVGALVFTGGIVFVLVLQVRNYVLDQGRTGWTYGKRKVGIRTVQIADGQPPGAGSCLGRWLLHGLINQFFYVDYLWVLFDAPRKQTLTDKALSTIVVRQAAAARA